MNEITETKELKFTQEDILKTLVALDEEMRSSLMMIDNSKLVEMANNSEYLREVYQTFDWYISMYQSLKNATLAFVSELERQKVNGVEQTIDTMIEHYKGLSREEKLEFNKKWLEETDFENSMDNFKYACSKLINSISNLAN